MLLISEKDIVLKEGESKTYPSYSSLLKNIQSEERLLECYEKAKIHVSGGKNNVYAMAYYNNTVIAASGNKYMKTSYGNSIFNSLFKITDCQLHAEMAIIASLLNTGHKNYFDLYIAGQNINGKKIKTFPSCLCLQTLSRTKVRKIVYSDP